MIFSKSIFTSGLLVISFLGYGTSADSESPALRGSVSMPAEEEGQHRSLATCCPATGYALKATSDCTQFSTCQNGNVLSTQPCPAGLLFDDNLQTCNWPNMVTCSGCGGNTVPAPAPTAPAPGPVSSTGGSATCGSGNRGNGICPGGLCCSQWGYCGSGPAYCQGSQTAPAPAPTGGGSGYTIYSPSVTLSVTDVQAGVGEWNSLQGGNVAVSQDIVNQINQITVNNNYNLFNQLAFVTHTIWESGAFQHKVEQDQSNWNNYQDCDWNTPGIQYPTNGQLFYGRGYLQLSWCANYKAYGQARMVNKDPDFFTTTLIS